MINAIIDGICVALSGEFGEGYEIYPESVEQGLNEPCFFVNVLNPTYELFLGKRYKRNNNFMLQYFPAGDEKNLECQEVAERLFGCLEYITVNGDLMRGAGMGFEIVDGVLNFKVDYDTFVRRVENTEKMESYTVEQEVTEDK